MQVLPANPRGPSTSQQVGKALGSALSGGLQIHQQNQQNAKRAQALKLAGLDESYSYLPEEVQRAIALKKFAPQKSLTSLEEAQRDKILQELRQTKEEDSFYNRLMGIGREPEPSGTSSPSSYDEYQGMDKITPESGLEDEVVPTKRTPKQPRFDYNDPSTWTAKQINNFRAYKGKNTNGQSLATKAQNEFEYRQESKKAATKYQQDIAPFQSAIEVIDTMEKLGKKGNLGIGTSVRGIISPQTRKDAAEYERLGKSLIQFSSNIPIRNRQEFEALAHDLYDPSISDDARSGILAAMKRIIQSSMQGFVAPGEEEIQQPRGTTQTQGPIQKERPPLTSFLR